MKKSWDGKSATAVLFLAFLFGFLFIIIFFRGPGLYAGVKKAVKEEITKEADIFQVAQAGIRETENRLNETLPKKRFFVNLHGLFNRILGRKYIEDSASSLNDIYKMENGQLTYSYRRKKNMKKAVKNMRNLKETCMESGAELIFLQYPFKVDKHKNLLPHGMKDTSNKNCNYFLKKMKKYSIPYVDYREVLGEREEEYSTLFYNGDHHWRTETAFLAYGYFMGYLEKNYGYLYDKKTVEAENFFFVDLPHSFIGSQTNRTGTWYGMIDDFTYIYPKFDTEFQWRKYNGNGIKVLGREGGFEDTLLFKGALEKEDVPMAYRDNCYFNGNPALVEIINEKVSEGEILFVTDSFGKPFISFAALNFHKTVFMDLRDYKMSLLSYIENNRFDYVIVSYGANAYKGETYREVFDFSKSADQRE